MFSFDCWMRALFAYAFNWLFSSVLILIVVFSDKICNVFDFDCWMRADKEGGALFSYMHLIGFSPVCLVLIVGFSDAFK